MKTENKVVDFGKKKLDRGIASLENYFKALEAPTSLSQIAIQAAEKHFEVCPTKGDFSFDLNAIISPGIFELVLLGISAENREDEPQQLLVRITCSRMNMAIYAPLSGLTPIYLDTRDDEQNFLQKEFKTITGITGPRLNEAIGYALWILREVVIIAPEIFVVEQRNVVGVGDRLYFTIIPAVDSDECDFITITISQKAFEMDRSVNKEYLSTLKDSSH